MLRLVIVISSVILFISFPLTEGKRFTKVQIMWHQMLLGSSSSVHWYLFRVSKCLWFFFLRHIIIPPQILEKYYNFWILFVEKYRRRSYQISTHISKIFTIKLPNSCFIEFTFKSTELDMFLWKWLNFCSQKCIYKL